MLHRGDDAVYLAVDGGVLGVLSSTATAVPCALQTTLSRLPDELRLAAHAVVGDGRVVLGGTEVVPARRVDASVPRLPRAAVARATRLLDLTVGDRLAPVRAELPAQALADLARGAADGVPDLLGRGSGLTPVGDDVLCGWLALDGAAAVAGVRAGAADGPVRDAVRRLAPAATTALSATLLACALRGEVLPQFRLLVLDLADPRTTDLEPRLCSRAEALLRVGHTSGAGLLLGATLALHHLASRSPAR